MPRGAVLSGASADICRYLISPSLLGEIEISLNLEGTAPLTFEISFA